MDLAVCIGAIFFQLYASLRYLNRNCVHFQYIVHSHKTLNVFKCEHCVLKAKLVYLSTEMISECGVCFHCGTAWSIIVSFQVKSSKIEMVMMSAAALTVDYLGKKNIALKFFPYIVVLKLQGP